MCKLTRKQIETLELFRRGKKPRDIEKLTPYSSVEDAIRRGEKNIDQAIMTLEIAVKKNLMTNDQQSRVKRFLDKI